jgi:uncharacterized protein (UPF0335 family)
MENYISEITECGQEFDAALYELNYYTESSDIIYDLSVFIGNILEALIKFFKEVDEKISKTIYKLKLHHKLRQLKKEYANNKAEFIKRMSGKKPTFFDMMSFKKAANDYIKSTSDAITRIDKSFRLYNVDARVERDITFITSMTKEFEDKLNDKNRFIKTASSWDEAIDKYIHNIEHYESDMKGIEDQAKKVYELSKQYIKKDNEFDKEQAKKMVRLRKVLTDFAHGVKVTIVRMTGLILMAGGSTLSLSSIGKLKDSRGADIIENVSKSALGGITAKSGYKIMRYSNKLERDYKDGKYE